MDKDLLKKYEHYSAEDFLRDDAFRAWMLSGLEENSGLWEAFLRRFPAKASTLTMAKATFNALHETRELPSEQQGTDMWQSIRSEISSREHEARRANIFAGMDTRWSWLAAASVLLMMMSLGWYFSAGFTDKAASYDQQVSNVRIVLTERNNDTRKPQKIQLTDGSYVVLQPGSKLSYQEQFTGAKREVYLSGQAYFKVAKNLAKPFIVYANKLVVQVVGTSFTVNADKNAFSGSVSVETGKVKVFTYEKYLAGEITGAGDEILLTPNQQVTYNFDSEVFSKSVVSEPVIQEKPEAHPDFYFKNTSVADVFRTLEKSYGVKINCDEKNIGKCNLTAPLGNEPLFRKMDIICQTIGATYEVWGTEIIVSGKGCKN
ncbi:FecR family protein [Dyadobacter bucti]|uniref:FecR family protein n=1 Tax=Dyadobacter bucti TaxID=2572203 RepID=UPI003F6F48EE